jgi:hypothetical protein
VKISQLRNAGPQSGWQRPRHCLEPLCCGARRNSSIAQGQVAVLQDRKSRLTQVRSLMSTVEDGAASRVGADLRAARAHVATADICVERAGAQLGDE